MLAYLKNPVETDRTLATAIALLSIAAMILVGVGWPLLAAIPMLLNVFAAILILIRNI
jgi:hypothetical protein